MSTSVTNASKRTSRTFLTYLGLSAFFFIFSRIYENFSYGEVSFFMHYLFSVTALGGALLVFFLLLKPTLSRLTYQLWNTGVAVLSAGFLLRGIINLSGRSTTLDQPYWYVGGLFLLLALLAFFLPRRQKRVRN